MKIGFRKKYDAFQRWKSEIHYNQEIQVCTFGEVYSIPSICMRGG